jgi:exopolyphosphatase/guanosine-5'-triphosphate,3'-diphosphate pyrophosphatase
MIMTSVIDLVGAKTMVASGSGVREGVFLSDLLRNQNSKFPPNFNPSVKSLTDRFCDNEDEARYIRKTALELFEVLFPLHRLAEQNRRYLAISAQLMNIGSKLSFYNHRHHSFNFILSNLEYGFSHFEKVLISQVVKYHGKRFSYFDEDEFSDFCRQNEQSIKWLSTILTIAETINSDMSAPTISFEYTTGILTINTNSKLYICMEKLRSILKNLSLSVELNTTQNISQ